jgi:hypothetical protein
MRDADEFPRFFFQAAPAVDFDGSAILGFPVRHRWTTRFVEKWLMRVSTGLPNIDCSW